MRFFMNEPLDLSRRERQIMEIIYAREEASATDVLQELPDAPTRTSVRTLLRILEQKGHLVHTRRGREFYFQPTHARHRAGQSAFRRVLRTFFDGSLEKAVAAYLSDSGTELSPEELKGLSEMIAQAKGKEE